MGYCCNLCIFHLDDSNPTIIIANSPSCQNLDEFVVDVFSQNFTPLISHTTLTIRSRPYLQTPNCNRPCAILIYLNAYDMFACFCLGSSGDPAVCDMNLLPTPLYSLPTDNTHFLTIKGSDNGRIFLGARDGCLYEIVYQVTMNNMSIPVCPGIFRVCGGLFN